MHYGLVLGLLTFQHLDASAKGAARQFEQFLFISSIRFS